MKFKIIWFLCFLLFSLSANSFGQCPPIPVTGIDVQVISCGSYTWIDGNSYTAPNNTAIDTLTTEEGCDSIVTLNLIQVDSNGLTQQGDDMYGGLMDAFGYTVSMSDAYTLAVGAPRHNVIESGGYVRIYSWNGTVWTQKGLDLEGDIVQDEFGSSVSMPDSNTIVIGAPCTDYLNIAGYTRVYRWNGIAWIQKGNDIDGETNTDLAGHTVCMPDSNTLAIGAKGSDDNGVLSGQVRVYYWNGITWIQKGNGIDGESSFDYSGSDISMPDSNTIAIGAPFNDGSGENAGHVRIYRWNDTVWVQKGIDIDGEITNEGFGSSVSMPDSNTIAVGAPKNNDNGYYSGQIRIYNWDGIAWVQKGIDINGEATGDELGRSVSMPNPNIVAVGGPNHYGNGINSGHIQIYKWDGFFWQQIGGDINGEGIANYFGSSVSMPDSQTVSVGAFGNSSNGNYSGHVSVYKLYQSYITNATSSTDVQEACDSYTWIDGNTYTETNTIAIYTLTNAAGCDSIITLDLTINSNSGTDVQIACDSFTWIDGNTYTESNNTAIHTLTNTVGCDSIITLDLTINSNSGNDVHVACNSYTWIDGNTYTESNNTASYTLTNVEGCDSVITLDITINSNTGIDVQEACDSYTWIDGNTYTESNNTALYTLMNVLGCDSVVTLDLTIGSSNTGIDVQEACDSYTWIDGNTYTELNNTATYTLTNVTGCDSIVTLDLTMGSSTAGTDVQVTCDSFTWIDGTTYTESNNTATYTLTNVEGCDSVIILDLTINSNTVNDIHVACNSYTWIDGNTYTESNNTASYTLTNVEGCDSVITLDLTIGSNTGIDVQEACDSYTWIDGNIYTESNNTAMYTLINALGCDSVVTLDLTIGSSNTGMDVQEACDSYTWIDGNTYTESNNTATYTLTNVTGCDSIVTLDLTIGSSNMGTDVQVACDSYTWIDGNTYTESNNTATYTLTNITGCDSIVALDLTIGSPNAGVDVQEACNSYMWIDGNTYTTSSNSVTYSLTNVTGCDSVVTLALSITTLDTTVDVSGQTLTSNQVGGTYQWVDCDNGNSIIVGETNQSFLPSTNGNYAVIVSDGHCEAYSVCTSILNIGVDEYDLSKDVSVFPNPNNGIVSVDLGKYKDVQIKVFNVTGQLIYNKAHISTPLHQFKLNAAIGIYFVEVYANHEFKRVKLFVK